MGPRALIVVAALAAACGSEPQPGADAARPADVDPCASAGQPCGCRTGPGITQGVLRCVGGGLICECVADAGDDAASDASSDSLDMDAHDDEVASHDVGTEFLDVGVDASSDTADALPAESGADATTTADAPRDAADACTNTDNDPANCGACGNRCMFPNATASCVRGLCGVGACLRGRGNCDGTNANGCEADLNEDRNCGVCDNRCPAGAPCVGGICTGTTGCGSGLTFCRSRCVDVTNDPDNCGACGTSCPMGAGRFCYQGQCESAATTAPPYRQCFELGARCPAPQGCVRAPTPTAGVICTSSCRSDADCLGPSGVCLPALSGSGGIRWCTRSCSGAGADRECADLGSSCRGFGTPTVWGCARL